MSTQRIGVVIPALNETRTIAQIIENVKKFAEVIVVDDGSHDGTGQVALRAGAKVCIHPVNLGYDEALNTGFKHAHQIGCNVIITLDADGQHNPDLLPAFIQAMQRGADMVIGIRSKYHRIAEQLFSLYTNIRFGIKDPLCGLKAYQTALYEKLGHFDAYKSIGTELMLFGARKKCRIEQIPFTVRDRADKSRFGQIFKANLRIIRALFLGMFRKS